MVFAICPADSETEKYCVRNDQHHTHTPDAAVEIDPVRVCWKIMAPSSEKEKQLVKFTDMENIYRSLSF